MTKPLSCIMLVDDDYPTNFYHQIVIEDAGFAEKVIAIQSAKEALKYLTSEFTSERPKPQIIFLDVNMPAMNGWEFLEEYSKKLKSQLRPVIIMLSTSSNLEDIDKARSNPFVADYLDKPLTLQLLKNIKVWFDDSNQNF